jgi:hypothetical protein
MTIRLIGGNWTITWDKVLLGIREPREVLKARIKVLGEPCEVLKARMEIFGAEISPLRARKILMRLPGH